MWLILGVFSIMISIIAFSYYIIEYFIYNNNDETPKEVLIAELDAIDNLYEENIERPEVDKTQNICINCEHWWESGMYGDKLCGLCKLHSVFIDYDSTCGKLTNGQIQIENSI